MQEEEEGGVGEGEDQDIWASRDLLSVRVRLFMEKVGSHDWNC